MSQRFLASSVAFRPLFSSPLQCKSSYSYMQQPGNPVAPRSALRLLSYVPAQKCWTCGSIVKSDTFFCGCEKNAILPVDPRRNLFSVLNCPKSFTIDPVKLQATFRSLQAQLHPDKFAKQPAEAQAYSADQSSLVNTAFQTLQSPLQRGLYLLEVNGHSVDENTTSTDQTFLMHMMDLNEALDDIETEEDLTGFLPGVQELVDGCILQATAAFDTGNFTAAKEQICQLKYFVNIQKRAKDKLLAADLAS